MSNVQISHFSARARVVDLLGREQIADAVTAISELLKNAIDAQADSAEVNFLKENDCLLIEDSGLGMRLKDLLDKWLVIATDSKRSREIDEDYYRFATITQKENAKKPTLGEKGIGRLAVAALGRGVLIWTRWGKGKDAERILMLIHWHLFRHPKLTLEDIIIPYIVTNEREATAQDALLLIKEINNWCKKNDILWKTESEKKIFKELKQDINFKFPDCIKGLKNFKMTPGTLFAILGTTNETEDIYNLPGLDLDYAIKEMENIKLLFGFCNPFVNEPVRLHLLLKRDGESIEYTDFWTADDYEKVDHTIKINIDENGFATGEIRRFKDKFVYQYQTKALPARASNPGELIIHIGYVEGNRVSSIIQSDLYEEYKKRLVKYGALYIYIGMVLKYCLTVSLLMILLNLKSVVHLMQAVIFFLIAGCLVIFPLTQKSILNLLIKPGERVLSRIMPIGALFLF